MAIAWRNHKKGENLIMVYGFRNDRRRYEAVLTLYNDHTTDCTSVFGFLNKGKALALPDLWTLWKLLNEIVETEYILFEVLPEHMAMYKATIPILETTTTKTFTGFRSILLKALIKKNAFNQ